MDISVVMKDNGYDYLIKMPIYNLTLERIEELEKEKDQKTAIFTGLQDTTVEQIWLGELKNLEQEYQKFLKQKQANQEDNQVKKKVIKKKKK